MDTGIEEQSTGFVLSGQVRELQFQAETAEDCEEWLSVLRNKDCCVCYDSVSNTHVQWSKSP